MSIKRLGYKDRLLLSSLNLVVLAALSIAVFKEPWSLFNSAVIFWLTWLLSAEMGK